MGRPTLRRPAWRWSRQRSTLTPPHPHRGTVSRTAHILIASASPFASHLIISSSSRLFPSSSPSPTFPPSQAFCASPGSSTRLGPSLRPLPPSPSGRPESHPIVHPLPHQRPRGRCFFPRHPHSPQPSSSAAQPPHRAPRPSPCARRSSFSPPSAISRAQLGSPSPTNGSTQSPPSPPPISSPLSA